MAMGGENSCKLARDSQLHEELLQLLQKWIEGQDLSEKDLLAIPPGQPLRLRLLRLSSKLLEIRIGTFFGELRSASLGDTRSQEVLKISLKPAL